MFRRKIDAKNATIVLVATNVAPIDCHARRAIDWAEVKAIEFARTENPHIDAGL